MRSSETLTHGDPHDPRSPSAGPSSPSMAMAGYLDVGGRGARRPRAADRRPRLARPRLPLRGRQSADASATTAADLSPTVSPAPVPGGRLAYGRFSPDGTHVFTAKTDGTDEQALLPSIAEGPRFSPDGRQLAVAVQSPQGLLFVGLVNPDGSDYVRFDSPDPTLNLGCFAWSPDGSRLACEGWDDSNAARSGIYTVRASDGGGLTRVTTSPGGGHDVVGDYSPDGRQIVFLRDDLVDEEHNTLMVVNVDGSRSASADRSKGRPGQPLVA